MSMKKNVGIMRKFFKKDEHAILSGIHAYPDALERVLADAKSCGAEKFLCLGDVVGYAAAMREREIDLPAWVAERLRKITGRTRR